MAILPSISDILVVIVLLIPGFVAFQIFQYLAIVERKIPEFEMTVWSLFFSLGVYAFFSFITGINDLEIIKENIFQPLYLFFLLGISLGFGAIIGVLTRCIFGKQIIPKDCWYLFQEKLGESGAYVIIYTQNGLEYKGKLHYSGREEAPKDVIIHNPKLILRNKNWNVIEEIEMGNELLFTEKDIARILFFKDI